MRCENLKTFKWNYVLTKIQEAVIAEREILSTIPVTIYQQLFGIQLNKL